MKGCRICVYLKKSRNLGIAEFPGWLTLHPQSPTSIRSSSNLVVFHFGRPPFWSSSIMVVFHFGRLPFWFSSILVVSHFGRLPFWSSSILVVFHFGRLPFW